MRTTAAALLLACSLCASPVRAAVVGIDVASRRDVLGGKPFGDAGAYEVVTGRVRFSVAVANAHNRGIVDLANAVSLAHGEVAFSATFLALRPKDPAKGNGSLLLEVPNRGRPGIVRIVDGGDPDLAGDAGDAWLLRRGFTVVSLGWQWDAVGPDALRLEAPIAREKGATITGLLRGDFMLSEPAEDVPLGHLIVGRIGGSEYPVAAVDDPRNVLTVRDTREALRQIVPRSRWRFARVVGGALQPSDRHIHLDGGFSPGKIYEYVYVVRDPVVAGLGFAAVRDFASWSKYGTEALFPARRVIAEGISQNGRFLRDFLYQGFNADERGERALDGVLAHVAGAGRGSFNFRFCQPSRDAQPTSSVDFPTDVFPFTDLPEVDPLTHERAGLLDRAAADGVVPRIFLSGTSYEYWGRAASLIHTSADGAHDATLSPDLRVYVFTGLQHFSGPFPPARGKGDLVGREPQSPLPVRFFWRAMIAAMDAWVRADVAPPGSRYPRVGDGTLVPLEKLAFPDIPGVRPPREANRAFRMDFGTGWPTMVTRQPPRVGAPYPVLVPQVDADGNDRAGVRLPEITVPLATYTGWNYRDPSIGAPNERVSFEGSYLPFPRTAAARERVRDPRLSVAERYTGRADYLARYGRAVDALVAERWILPEDRAALLGRAAEEWALVTGEPADP